jgi:alanine racemase
VDGFCVALIEEGVELREAGVLAPILVMGGHYGNAYDEVIARGLTPVVHDLGQVEAFARLVRSGEVTGPIQVHLKVDTGMARLGVTMSELPALGARLAEWPEVHICGLMTHLACADAPTRAPTDGQLARLQEATAILQRNGVCPQQKHAANSAALLRGLARLDAVRPGIALFGVAPRIDGTPLTNELKPVMRVRTEIVALRDISAGDSVGYGATWSAPQRSRIATLPLGYADGLSRRLGNRGHVLVRGKRAPIVGSVSMDMTMVDVTSIEGARVRDEAVVLGVQDGPLGRDVIGADEIASQTDTIAWEVLTSVSRRVPRFYRDP